MQYFHQPVLLPFIIDNLIFPQDQLVIDATCGEGGHTLAFLKKGLRVIGLDRDATIQERCRERCRGYDQQLELKCENFSRSKVFLNNTEQYDFVLFDLGISNFHYKNSGRGFSFQADEKLDMRLEPDLPESAADIVNTMPEQDLRNLFLQYGEEKKSSYIAMHIARRREIVKFELARDFAQFIENICHRQSHRHPATKIFQALRIYINNELTAISDGLHAAITNLRCGGRIAVLSYHSLEDRIVKKVFREFCGARRKINRYRENPQAAIFHLFLKSPLAPELAEIRDNPSSRSARLRVIMRADPQKQIQEKFKNNRNLY